MSKVNDIINEIKQQKNIITLKYNNAKEEFKRAFSKFEKANYEYKNEIDKIDRKYENLILELLKGKTLEEIKYSKNN